MPADPASRPPSEPPVVNSTASADASTASLGKAKRGVSYQTLIMLAIFGGVLFLQWPMLKGMFYRVAGVQPVATVEWQPDFEQASQLAAATEKPILLVFGASWCPGCVVMQHDVWSDATVGKVANEQFVPVYVDVDSSRQADIVRRYGVGAIPSVLIVDAGGQVLREANNMSRSATLKFLSVSDSTEAS